MTCLSLSRRKQQPQPPQSPHLRLGIQVGGVCGYHHFHCPRLHGDHSHRDAPQPARRSTGEPGPGRHPQAGQGAMGPPRPTPRVLRKWAVMAGWHLATVLLSLAGYFIVFIYFYSSLKDMSIDFRERGRKGGERNINQLPPVYARTRDQNYNFLVHGTTLPPPDSPGRGPGRLLLPKATRASAAGRLERSCWCAYWGHCHHGRGGAGCAR